MSEILAMTPASHARGSILFSFAVEYSHGGQHVLTEGEGSRDDGQIDTRLRILAHEADAHATGQEDERAVGARGADLRNLGGVIGLADLGVDLADQLALKLALETGQRIGAGGIVGRHDEGVGIAQPSSLA